MVIVTDNKNLDSPFFMDNLSAPDNMSKNTHTELFKLHFSGVSLNNTIEPSNSVFMRI